MFRRKRETVTEGSPGPGLRRLALDVDPSLLRLDRSAVGDVWGVVMDTVFADGGWYTLVVFADGATSLYTSGSFGIIGAGEHAEVREVGDELLAITRQRLELFDMGGDDDLPAPGYVALRAMTFNGQRVIVAVEDALGEGRHPASQLFYAAHEVIAKVREIEESSQRRP